MQKGFVERARAWMHVKEVALKTRAGMHRYGAVAGAIKIVITAACFARRFMNRV